MLISQSAAAKLTDANPITNIFGRLSCRCNSCVDCKELVGVLTGDDGVGFGEINTAQINVVQLLRIY